MTIADQLLDEARALTEGAIQPLQLKSGNASTRVIPGYPYTVVSADAAKGVSPAQLPASGATPAFKFLPPNKIQFFPQDPRITFEGVRCYSRKPPLAELPRDKTVFIFFEVKVTVQGDTQCLGVSSQSFPESVRVDSLTLRMLDEIPEESHPVHTCGGTPNTGTDHLKTIGEHVYYTPFLVSEGVGKTFLLRDLSTTNEYSDELGYPESEMQYWQRKNGISRNSYLYGYFSAGRTAFVPSFNNLMPSHLSVADANLAPAP